MDFWNINQSVWDKKGCFVYNISNNTVTCGWTHLTSFSISKDKIIPEANILTEIDWITFAGLLIIFCLICLINPRSDKDSKSIIALEDIIYRSVQKEKLWADIVGKEIKYITNLMPNKHRLGQGLKSVTSSSEAKRSLYTLQFKLFKTYLRNDHTLLSVFQRTAGTQIFVLNKD